MNEYGLLPWWACEKCLRVGNGWKSFPWSARALLSVLLNKLASLKAIMEPGIGKGWIDPDDFWSGIGNYGDEQHFACPLRYLETVTGLSKHAIIDAKRCLAEWGIVKWDSRYRPNGGDDADLLYPNCEFFVGKQSLGDEGRCYLSIERRAS